ncbi:MAG: tetratricopeptide repeat protein [Candidatus Lokiarchaeota archaeon]|nr:tetratricopeptide repeat protein [Candidatus Lokiarchaeota archaeon]
MQLEDIPPEFAHLRTVKSIPWDVILKNAEELRKNKPSEFEAFTDAAIEYSLKEIKKKRINYDIVAAGVEACLTRGKIADALDLTKQAETVPILSLRAIIQFVLSDTHGLGQILSAIEEKVSDDSNPSDLVRLSVVKVLQAAAERDTSVIMCVMEFDNLLETYPEQVEEPIIETMFALYVVGSLLREVGQANRAKRITDTLEDMAESKNHRMMLALVENLRGNICNLLGEFTEAEDHYLRFQELSEELSFELGLGMALNNLGTLRLNSLRLEEAVEYFEAALAYMKMDVAKVVSLANLGEIQTILGKYQDAEKHLIEGIQLEEKTKRGIIEVYTWYVILLVKKGNLKKAQEYLKKAEVIAEHSEKPLQKAAYLHSKGVFEAAMGDFTSAVEVLESVVRLSKKNVAFEHLVRSKLELSRVYLKAYHNENNEEYLASSTYHIQDIIQIAGEQGLKALYAEALVIRSDILTIAGKINEAKGDAERVLGIAEFLEDERLLQEACLRIEAFEARTRGIEPKKYTSTMDRIAGFKPAGKIKEVPRPLLHAIIALNRSSGLPEYVHYFDTTIEMDSSIIGGFITAINQFSKQMMGLGGLLRSINHEGFTVMMEHSDERIMTLICNEETFDMRYLLREFARKFNEKYPPVIDMDGIDSRRYAGADQLVSDIFGSSD